jgi:hypothetical protein
MCDMYKLAQGCNLLICNELFIVGRYIVFLIVGEIIQIVNIILKKNMISWPSRGELEEVVSRFKNLCGLPSIHDDLNGTNFPIVKLVNSFSEDYYHHKNEGYTIVCQLIVDH